MASSSCVELCSYDSEVKNCMENMKAQVTLNVWLDLRNSVKFILEHAVRMLDYIALCYHPLTPYKQISAMYKVLKKGLFDAREYYLSHPLKDLALKNRKFVAYYIKISNYLKNIKEDHIHLEHLKLIFRTIEEYASYCVFIAEYYIGLELELIGKY